MAASTSRRTCAALPGHSETVQLSATARLGVSCEPAEGGGSAAPCLHEPFFHFAKGFETMSEQEFAAHSDKKRNGIDPFVQCRIRRVGIDSDWPTVDTELERTATTKTIVDVMSLLGERTVTMIGASLVRQTLGAVQCQLEAGNLRRKHELQWRQWGWSTYSEDSKGCSNFSARFRGPLKHPNKEAHWRQLKRRAELLRAAGCVTSEHFMQMLNRSDVVIVAYNPQHYDQNLDWWRYDLEQYLPVLSQWVQEAPTRRLAMVREPPAQHFMGGAFNHSQLKWISQTQGCCVPLTESEAYGNLNWHAAVAVHEMVAKHGRGHVRVLPWYNHTLRRWRAHIGTRAACFERGDGEVWTRKVTCACDCTHFCYTPLLYDATLFTPLHAALAEQHAFGVLHAEQRRAARRERYYSRTAGT